MTEKLQKIFKEYNLVVIKDFISHFMPSPEKHKYEFFKIKTADNHYCFVWGENEEEILSLFERFLNIRMFI